MSTLSVTLLGRFEAHLDNRPLPKFRTTKEQALLIYLIAEPRPHSRESLIDLLWPDMAPSAARQNLRQTLYYLRGAIPELGAGEDQQGQRAPLLLANRQAVQLNSEAGATADIDQFQSLVDLVQKHDHPDLPHCQQCRQNLQEAASLYQGDFLTDFYLPDSSPFEAWAAARRAELQRQYLDLLQKLGRIHLARGHYAVAEEAVRKQIAVDDLREIAQRQLLEVLVRTGRRNEALTHYDALRQRLWDELAVAPEPSTIELVEQIERGQLKDTPAAAGAPFLDRKVENRPRFLAEDAIPMETNPRFVARARELAQLEAALESAQDSHGQVMFVIGGAGRGKTTLTREFARRATDANPELLVITGNCAAITGVGDPYLPFREALAMLTGDVEAKWEAGLINQQQAERLWKLLPVTLTALVDHGPNLLNNLLSAQVVLARVASWALRDGDLLKQLEAFAAKKQRSDLDQRRIFAEYIALLKAVATQRPLLIIIEDLHWIDSASSGLLFYLSREISNSQILLLGTYRPEEVALNRAHQTAPGHSQQHPLAEIVSELKRQYGDIWLDLGELAADEGRRFVDAYLDSQPNRLEEQFREELFRHTEGHPLFTVELLHAMQERRDLQQDEHGRWFEGQAIDWTTLPHKVEGVIERRIKRLDQELQDILAAASVEGETFTAEVVAEVQQLDQRSLVQQLSRDLDKRHRLLTAHAMEWLHPGRQRISIYRFRHQLFQHYLYHRLDKVQRAHLHEAIGHALEQLYEGQTEQVAGQLAYHFHQAGLISLAIIYFRQAGETAANVHAYTEAAAHYARALELAEQVEMNAGELAHLYTSLGMVLLVTKGDNDPEVGNAYWRAYELYQESGEPPQLFTVLRGLAMYHKLRGESETALELTEQMATLARNLRDPTLIVESSFAMGSLLFYRGQFRPAQAYLQQGIDNYDQKRHQSIDQDYDQDPGVALLSYAALSLWVLGYPDRGLRRSVEAVTLAQEIAHPYSLTMALIWSSWVHLFRREEHALRKQSQAAIDLSQKHEFDLFRAVGSLLNGWALAELSEVERGIKQMKWSLSTPALTLGAIIAPPFLLNLLTETYTKVGQVEEGSRLIRSAQKLIDKDREFLWVEAEIYRLTGDLQLQKGDSEEDVEANYQRAINIARRQKAKSFELRAVTRLGRLWQSQGRGEEARHLLAKTYGWFTEGFDTRDLLEARDLLQELS